MVILGYIGFRPGTFAKKNFRYDQVELGLVRDPDTNEARLIANITIEHNKLSKTKLDKGGDK